MYVTLAKVVMAVVTGAILVKESKNASDLYDKVREKLLATVQDARSRRGKQQNTHDGGPAASADGA